MDWIKHNWVMVVVVLAIAGSFAASYDYTNKTDKAAVQRLVDACNRANSTRAYLLLRAVEFTKTTDQKKSYTTKISHQTFAILNCDASVRDHKGAPVPVAADVQAQFLRYYRQRYMPLMRNGKITERVAFDRYFRVASEKTTSGASQFEDNLP
jgi:hypothetical protein